MNIRNLIVTLLAVLGLTSITLADMTKPLLDYTTPYATVQKQKQDQGPTAQSIIFDYKEGSIGLTYINDGIDGLAGLSTKIWQGNDKLKISAIAVSDFKSNANYYVGALATYRVFESPKGIKLDIGAGFKGIDITNGFNGLAFAGKHPFIWSVGVSFPIK